MRKAVSIIAFLILISNLSTGKNIQYDIEKMGLSPEKYSNFSPVISELISQIRLEAKPNDNVIIKFLPGKYIFLTKGTTKKDLFISDHDLVNPRNIALDLSGIDNLTIDGQGAEFIFDGRIIPIVADGCRNLTLKNLSIDFKNPQIAQFEIVNNLGDEGMIYYLAPWMNYDIDNKSGKLLNKGADWEIAPDRGVIFDRDSKRISYNSTDISINTDSSDSIENRIIESPYWTNNQLKPGMVIVGRGKQMPSPGIFIANSKDVCIEEVTIHYSEGSGFLAQRCENITLQKFNVNLRSKSDLRCFTTLSAASTFVDCKGKITSCNGIYENMMAEAINIHGTYLRVTSVSEDGMSIRATLEQGLQINWGEVSDSISFISSSTLNVINSSSINSISYDKEKKEYSIYLSSPFETGGTTDTVLVENKTWMPQIDFSNNIVRNNRGRGCRFSTPEKVVIKGNLFSHVSGCAIHLSADNHESGSCRDVSITQNRLIDVMTSAFDFSSAVITITAPDSTPINGEISIDNNYIETFDRPLVFAKSVKKLFFRKNIVYGDTREKPFNSNTYSFNFTKILNPLIEDNTFSGYIFNEQKDILNIQ